MSERSTERRDQRSTEMSRQVASEVFRVGRRMGATRKELLAAGVTGLVESGFRDLSGGDRDSYGWRQQREQFYPGSQSTERAAQNFFKELRGHRGKGLSVGELAQAVQRSAFPDRYQPRLAEAKRLLAGAGATSSRSTGGRAARTETVPGEMVVDKLGALRDTLLKGEKNPLLGADFALKSGAYTTQSPDRQRKIAGQFEGSAPSGRGQTRGGVKISPGANRKGQGMTPSILDQVERTAGIFGSTLTVGTGSNHSMMTSSGNRSDHFDGNGADIPATGRRLVRMGQAALIAAGMPAKVARTKQAGMFTLHKGGRRVQVIFGKVPIGGHETHLHIGVSG